MQDDFTAANTAAPTSEIKEIARLRPTDSANLTTEVGEIQQMAHDPPLHPEQPPPPPRHELDHQKIVSRETIITSNNKLQMVFYSNERSFLEWMRVSIMLAATAIGINLLSGTAAHPDLRWIVTRALSLLILLISIVLSCSAYLLFKRRHTFLYELREAHFYSNVWMPRFLTCVGITLMTVVWISALIRILKT